MKILAILLLCIGAQNADACVRDSSYYYYEGNMLEVGICVADENYVVNGKTVSHVMKATVVNDDGLMLFKPGFTDSTGKFEWWGELQPVNSYHFHIVPCPE